MSRVGPFDRVNDGYPHIRDKDGTCCNCGASKNEYHYPLKPRTN